MSAKLDNQVLKIDALLRQATAQIWNSLPQEKRNGEELQSEALRLLMRVIQNFADDLIAFGPSAAPPGTGESGAYERVRAKYPNSGKAWSAQADEELRKLYESGNSVGDLSIYFQRTPNGVRARLVKFGLLAATEFQPRFAA